MNRPQVITIQHGMTFLLSAPHDAQGTMVERGGAGETLLEYGNDWSDGSMTGTWMENGSIFWHHYIGIHWLLGKIAKKRWVQYFFESWKSRICKVLHVSKVYKNWISSNIGHSSQHSAWKSGIYRKSAPHSPPSRPMSVPVGEVGLDLLSWDLASSRSDRRTSSTNPNPWDPKMWTEDLGILSGWCNGAITILKNITVL